MPLQPLHQVTQKAANSDWGPEQDKALQQVQAIKQAILLLGLYNPGQEGAWTCLCLVPMQNGDWQASPSALR